MNLPSLSPDRKSVWTRHWASGAAHSCAGSFGDTYGGCIATFWRTLHAATQPGARVLDIATGNGALPRLLMELRPELPMAIDAVDLADVAPAWAAAMPSSMPARVRFHPAVAAEHLPFQTASFDLVVSQYGLEYTDAATAVPEVLRVLAPGGRAAFVLHHAQSRPVRLASVELGHLDWLRSAAGLMPASRAMLPLLARAMTSAGRAALAADPEAESIRRRFNEAQDSLRQRGPGADGGDLLHEVQDAVAGMLGLAAHGDIAAADRLWIGLDLALVDARLRLSELCACALDRSGVETLRQSLTASGSEILVEELREKDHVMGWGVRTCP